MQDFTRQRAELIDFFFPCFLISFWNQSWFQQYEIWQSPSDTIKCPAYICRAQAADLVNPRLRFVCNFSFFKIVKSRAITSRPIHLSNWNRSIIFIRFRSTLLYMPNIGMHITFFVLQKKKKKKNLNILWPFLNWAIITNTKFMK